MFENSLISWFPKIKALGIPTPKTEIVKLNKHDDELLPIVEGDLTPIQDQWAEILDKARKIGFPLFMRTDEFSGKHSWKDTCYVEKESDLKTHITRLFDESFSADFLGLPLRAIVFREYIPMANMFTAFHGDMPVNPEIRFFVKDGEVLCWHWYWIEDAIEQGTLKEKLPFDWRERIRSAKEQLSGNDILWLTNDARKVAQQFKGYWSVDFCLSRKREWILIDMALGRRSWHPEDCNTKTIK